MLLELSYLDVMHHLQLLNVCSYHNGSMLVQAALPASSLFC